MKLNTQKVALAFGVLLGGWHVLWSLVVLLGWAQPLLNFIFWLHMIANPYVVTGFALTQATLLVVVTAIVGYVGGWIFAWVWNLLHK